MITAEQLRAELEYEPDTGNFIRRRTGKIAGCDWRGATGTTYRKIGVGPVQYYAHRLAVLYMTGRWPASHVDHRNCIGTDNRWCNLREATPSENLANINVSRVNRTGKKGVHFVPHARRFRAMISKNGKSYHIGYFDTAEEANAAYAAKAQELHGEFWRA